MLLDIGCVMDNTDPLYQGAKRAVFLTILAVVRMVIWMTRKKRLYDGNLILLFRHHLRVKIRCERKHLDCITFNKKWVYAVSLVVQKEVMLESSFPPLLAHGNDDPGTSGSHCQ